MSDKQIVLQLKNINKDYRQGRSTIEVLKNINLEIKEGEFIALVEQVTGARGTWNLRR